MGCLRRALADARTGGTGLVRLDLSEVAFAHSSLLHATLMARAGAGRLVLVGRLPRQIRSLLEHTGTRALFDRTPDACPAM
ncbi:hypothetical protein [Streptomyces sp. NPDC002057]|uniref:hypothetical protein n=1 Tax=Streptomyces sp. NPDC002057 TaxID=3154664 RepID=UPI00331774C6